MTPVSSAMVPPPRFVLCSRSQWRSCPTPTTSPAPRWRWWGRASVNEWGENKIENLQAGELSLDLLISVDANQVSSGRWGRGGGGRGGTKRSDLSVSVYEKKENLQDRKVPSGLSCLRGVCFWQFLNLLLLTVFSFWSVCIVISHLSAADCHRWQKP